MGKNNNTAGNACKYMKHMFDGGTTRYYACMTPNILYIIKIIMRKVLASPVVHLRVDWPGSHRVTTLICGRLQHTKWPKSSKPQKPAFNETHAGTSGLRCAERVRPYLLGVFGLRFAPSDCSPALSWTNISFRFPSVHH